MAIYKGRAPQRREIDLSGPEGNAYSLLGIAKNLSKQLDMDFDAIRAEMTSSNYEHLVTTFNKYFGDYVDVYYGFDEVEEFYEEDNEA